MDDETRKRLIAALGSDSWTPPPPLEKVETEVKTPPNVDAELTTELKSKLTLQENRAPVHGGSSQGVQQYNTPADSDEDDQMTTPAMVVSKKTHPVAFVGRHKARNKPLPKSLASELIKIGFKSYNLDRGDRAPSTMTFAPWMMVVNYPEMYVGKGNHDRVAELFQIETLFATMSWDFFYLWDVPAPSKDKSAKAEPELMLFVPTEQVQRILDITNAELQIASLSIPRGNNELRFKISFGKDDTPLPRFLGRVEGCFDEFKDLAQRVPKPDPEDSLENLDDRIRVLFRNKLSYIESWHVKGKKNHKSGKNKMIRYQKHIYWGREMKRVQRYLGIRTHKSLLPPAFSAGTGRTPIIKEIDMNKPVPHLSEEDPIFVCIDVELYEFNHSEVTEVGIATLDTRDIIGIPPGPGCENWFKLIKARHLRVKGTEHLVNRVHVLGNEENFNFGDSEILDMDEIYAIVKSILEQEQGCEPPAGVPIFTKARKARRVVLVGHDAESDIMYLRKIGYDVMENPHLLEVVDTAHLNQFVERKMDPASLGNVLSSLSIPFSHLHNGGNDAVHTLQAMIVLAFKKRGYSIQRHNLVAKSNGEITKPVDEEGWDSGGEWSDGGFPAGGVDSVTSDGNRTNVRW